MLQGKGQTEQEMGSGSLIVRASNSALCQFDLHENLSSEEERVQAMPALGK